MLDGLLVYLDLIPMNCADRDEEERRSVSLEDLFQSWRTAFDHDKILAADTAASTPESSRARDLCRARVGAVVDLPNGLG